MVQKQKNKRERQIFFSVYIVESPSPVDLYHKMWEGEILLQALSLAGIPSTHKLAVNLEAFRASFIVGLQEYLEKANALPPILHISAHGSISGIELTSKEVLGWDKLRDLIMPINKALKGNLILCVSSCEGFAACRMAMKEGDIPFLGMVGHPGSPTWSDTAVAFATFYHLLAKGYYFQGAVEAMRIASGDKGFMGIQGKTAKEIYIKKVEELRMQAILEALSKIVPKVESPLAKALKREK